MEFKIKLSSKIVSIVYYARWELILFTVLPTLLLKSFIMQKMKTKYKCFIN